MNLMVRAVDLALVSILAGFASGAWVNARPPRAASSPHPAGVPQPTKTARFLLLMTERHGPLAGLSLHPLSVPGGAAENEMRVGVLVW